MSLPVVLHRAYCLLKCRAYHVVLRTPRFRTAKSVAPVGPVPGERRPERPKRTVASHRLVPDRPSRAVPDRSERRAADRRPTPLGPAPSGPAPSGPSPRRPAPDRLQRSVPDRPHRRTKALAG